MKLDFTVEQVNKITQTIDAGLKNTHVGGLNVMEGAVIFAQGVTRAQQQEQNEIIQRESKVASDKIIASMPADSASQLG